MLRIIFDIKEYWEYTVQAAKSQLKAEVANSYLNWLWWVIEPLAMMMIYALVFGVVFGITERYHPLFIFLGVSMWSFFNRCVRASTTLIKNKKGIIEKVYIPKYFFVIQEMLVNGFKLLICLVVVVIMMIYYQVPPSPRMFMIIPVVIVFFVITFAVCTFLLNFGAYIEDLHNAISIILTLLTYATGIFYNIDTRIPAPFNIILGKMYPIGYLIGAARKSLLYDISLDAKLLFFWFVVGIVLAFQGIYLIYKNENTYIKVI